jgi:hypothetical protein
MTLHAPSRLARLLGLGLFLALTAASPNVLAQPRKGPPAEARAESGKVSVKLLVVAATDKHEGIDPRLQPLARHLNFLRYKGYDLLDTYTSTVGPDADASFTIDGGRRVTVSLLKKNPERAQFRIQMFNQAGKLLDTTLSVNRNGTFIVAGPKHGDGILILPLQVRY